jgi:hypothetical protein
VASRYAPHLEKCMGIGRMARNSSRIASRRMKALDDDVYTPNPSLYMASPSFGANFTHTHTAHHFVPFSHSRATHAPYHSLR